MDIYIAKADKSVSVDTDALNDDMREYIIRLGWTEALNTATQTIKAGSADASANAWALAMKKLEALRSGTLKTRSQRTSSPVRLEALALATASLKARWKTEGRKLDPRELRDAAMLEIDGNAGYMERAAANVAKREADVAELSAGMKGVTT